MKNNLQIPHDAIVFVGDGRKALFLRNVGDEKFPNLVTAQVFVDQNPSLAEQGAVRPDTEFKTATTAPSGNGIRKTAWHDLDEHGFARAVAAALEQQVRANKVKALVVVAPPRTLADLRQVFHRDVADRVIAEINKDLTNHPVDQIEKHLAA
ncbi:MAG: hypothetical protein QOD74_3029 [Variibacter sp.]|jgi:protein required for attachment to host cells|nr:hypothetical protein [Variibacter sp.]